MESWKFCQVDQSATGLLQASVKQMHLSARSYHRVLELSHTVADLAGAETIGLEPLQYCPTGRGCGDLVNPKAREQVRIEDSSMSLSPETLKQYHVFLASPGDVSVERQHVRQFFERYNRQAAQLWNVRFEVVDWENYTTVGVGRPQELITKQTLEKYRDSLALVIGIMGQWFGSPTGEAESGTEEEFNWAMETSQELGFPEIKWFFRRADKLEMPTDPTKAREAIGQWEKVLTFKRRMQDLDNPVFYAEYPSPAGFRDRFENDLNSWLADPVRPWLAERAPAKKITLTVSPPSKYYDNIEGDFGRLDIAGIDNDRTFEIPLS